MVRLHSKGKEMLGLFTLQDATFGLIKVVVSWLFGKVLRPFKNKLV